MVRLKSLEEKILPSDRRMTLKYQHWLKQRRDPHLLSRKFCLIFKQQSFNHLFSHYGCASKEWNFICLDFRLVWCLPKNIENWLPELLSAWWFKDETRVLWSNASRALFKKAHWLIFGILYFLWVVLGVGFVIWSFLYL